MACGKPSFAKKRCLKRTTRNAEDRFFASAYLLHLSNEKDEDRQSLLEARMNRMVLGQKFTLEHLEDVQSQGL
jgi:hypothetical protein